MFQFKCTKKVQDFIGITPSELKVIVPEKFALGNWFVHSFEEDNHNVLVFMEEKTLFSFIIVGIQKEHIKTLRKHFLEGLCLQMKAEGISIQTISAYAINDTVIQYTKTDSTNKVGIMNDLISLYQSRIEIEGGLSEIDIVDVAMKINRVPESHLALTYAVKEFKLVLGEVTSQFH
ncbi:DUF6933 domain-containing protein [Aliivibrio logei]|uniref:DUF6933 domain-containing protein n=1 Tax=Aliivibrio logei 5S-186 TaxID=626086 RepID=A0ABX3ATJ5_ALILO|nr:hypothetical protein [Aliivibrio logei]OEF11168.1 hypothetical protein A1Q5_12060 [Aliivibrio logei 5S-186]